MGDEMEPDEQRAKDAAMRAIIRESMEAAADRLIAQREREADKPARQILVPGHLYLIIGSVTLLALVVAGALSKGG